MGPFLWREPGHGPWPPTDGPVIILFIHSDKWPSYLTNGPSNTYDDTTPHPLRLPHVFTILDLLEGVSGGGGKKKNLYDMSLIKQLT